ncbi:response regulator [Gordonia amarae]|uniref:Response regulator n=2 Tax=Gordonia amarae TaxID=36821 RepID=A0A857L312_9ACTN|nr:response regulator transcription factor [Gordonia amarae]MCS3880857.1 two-component system response regulator DesR [Gordonia amarae]QHN19118.1 response regulator [Gordonia amarae]QHN23594.1 response regulator [Gordonia amarae]QHN32505.1 response regulator [Gordonia amarae]QHN41253.1 response regulator [Gordonia amarae]
MIPVFLADDEELIRVAMATMLDLDPEIEVKAHVGTGEELVALWHQHVDAAGAPAVAVIDLQLPGIDGIETAADILTVTPDAPIIIVTSHGRPGYLKRALETGIRGFLPKTTPASTLSEVIGTVHRGGRYVDPELAAEAISSGNSPLTPREADVLEYAITGASVEEIASRAHLSVGTTRNYLSSAMSKLDATNRYEAALKARSLGWI